MENNKRNLAMLVPQERYEQQLDDVRWKFKADNIRIRDKHECRLCGAKRTQLDVHHIRYINGHEAWDYDDGDLVTLCHGDSFAEFDDNRVFGSRCSWPSWTIPYAYFNVAPAKDVYEKPQKNNRIRVVFDEFDFSGYRAATHEEVYKWLEYEEHIENLHELGEDDLPF